MLYVGDKFFSRRFRRNVRRRRCGINFNSSANAVIVDLEFLQMQSDIIRVDIDTSLPNLTICLSTYEQIYARLISMRNSLSSIGIPAPNSHGNDNLDFFKRVCEFKMSIEDSIVTLIEDVQAILKIIQLGDKIMKNNATPSLSHSEYQVALSELLESKVELQTLLIPPRSNQSILRWRRNRLYSSLLDELSRFEFLKHLFSTDIFLFVRLSLRIVVSRSVAVLRPSFGFIVSFFSLYTCLQTLPLLSNAAPVNTIVPDEYFSAAHAIWGAAAAVVCFIGVLLLMAERGQTNKKLKCDDDEPPPPPCSLKNLANPHSKQEPSRGVYWCSICNISFCRDSYLQEHRFHFNHTLSEPEKKKNKNQKFYLPPLLQGRFL